MTRKRYNKGMGHIRTECIYCSHVAYVTKITSLSGKGSFYREVTYRCDSETCGLTWNSYAHVDIDRCNSNLIVIHDRHNKRRLYYTIEDILKTASALTVRPITQ